tara:strand:+ start:887 stop:1225 length:339 start_codon:yes stop_codon:yes gene_type:complete
MTLLGEQFFTIYNMDKSFAFKLAGILEKSTIDLLADLEVSVDKADAQKSKNILHTIKGSAANFGAEQLTEKTRQIESAIYLLSDDNKSDYKKCIVEIRDVFNSTLEELEKHK